MLALLRIILAIPLGYVAACIAAGIFAMASAYNFGGDPDFAMEGFVIGGGIVAGMYFGALALAPALLFVILAEAFFWRSFFTHVPAGGAIALGLTLAYTESAVHPAGKAAFMLAAGFIGGAVYWLIAGRNSGAGYSERCSRRLGKSIAAPHSRAK